MTKLFDLEQLNRFNEKYLFTPAEKAVLYSHRRTISAEERIRLIREILSENTDEELKIESICYNAGIVRKDLVPPFRKMMDDYCNALESALAAGYEELPFELMPKLFILPEGENRQGEIEKDPFFILTPEECCYVHVPVPYEKGSLVMICPAENEGCMGFVQNTVYKRKEDNPGFRTRANNGFDMQVEVLKLGPDESGSGKLELGESVYACCLDLIAVEPRGEMLHF